jgi:CheY-like chemotaxis protein
MPNFPAMPALQEGDMEQLKATILCIDDDGNALEARKELLESEGYEVFASSNGADGLRMFRSHPVDAVVLDYEMPRMSGDRVAHYMKQYKPQVPILMLSGHDSLSEETLIDVDRFISKDEAWRTFVDTLSTLVKLHVSTFDHWWENWRHQRRSGHDLAGTGSAPADPRAV